VTRLELSDHHRQELTPSHKLVLLILRESDRPIDLGEIADRTQLPKGTVRRRCRELIEHDLVSKQPSFRDARVTMFRANPPDPSP